MAVSTCVCDHRQAAIWKAINPINRSLLCRVKSGVICHATHWPRQNPTSKGSWQILACRVVIKPSSIGKSRAKGKRFGNSPTGHNSYAFGFMRTHVLGNYLQYRPEGVFLVVGPLFYKFTGGSCSGVRPTFELACVKKGMHHTILYTSGSEIWELYEGGISAMAYRPTMGLPTTPRCRQR